MNNAITDKFHDKYGVAVVILTNDLNTCTANMTLSPWISNADDFTSEPTNEVDGIINRWKSRYWNGS